MFKANQVCRELKARKDRKAKSDHKDPAVCPGLKVAPARADDRVQMASVAHPELLDFGVHQAQWAFLD